MISEFFWLVELLRRCGDWLPENTYAHV